MNSSPEIALDVRNLKVSFEEKDGILEVLEDINFIMPISSKTDIMLFQRRSCSSLLSGVICQSAIDSFKTSFWIGATSSVRLSIKFLLLSQASSGCSALYSKDFRNALTTL